MRLCYLPLLCLPLVTACNTNHGVLVCHVAGGETIRIAMTAKGPENASNKDVRVEAAAGFIEKEKLLKYGFVLKVLTGMPPQRIKVEDVSEREAEVLLEDTAPTLNEHGIWRGTSDPRTGEHKALTWLFHLDTSIRIYRLTIVTADGRTLVMYQASVVPAFIKTGMRGALDMK